MKVMLTNKAFQGGNSCSQFSKSSIWLEEFFFFHVMREKKGEGAGLLEWTPQRGAEWN